MNIFDLIAPPVYASCPVCIVTVGGGLILAKKLGVDDLLASIWISGLNSAIAFWLAPALSGLAMKVKIKLVKNPIFISFLFYLLTIAFLWFTKQFGHERNTFWGINKVLVGMTVGWVVFLLSSFSDKLLRKQNEGKVLFPYQKVIVPVFFLIGITAFFYALL